MIKNIFPVPIWKSRFPGNIQEQKNKILPQINEILAETKDFNLPVMKNNGLCSYNVCNHLDERIDISDVYDFVYAQVDKFWKELGYSKKGFYIKESWINRYPPNAYIETHNHAPMALSASFYLQKPEKSGEILFENPISTLLKYQPYEFSEISNYVNWFHESISVEEGDLVIFPNYLDHKTEINKSGSDRFIIGFNIVGKV